MRWLINFASIAITAFFLYLVLYEPSEKYTIEIGPTEISDIAEGGNPNDLGDFDKADFQVCGDARKEIRKKLGQAVDAIDEGNLKKAKIEFAFNRMGKVTCTLVQVVDFQPDEIVLGNN